MNCTIRILFTFLDGGLLTVAVAAAEYDPTWESLVAIREDSGEPRR